MQHSVVGLITVVGLMLGMMATDNVDRKQKVDFNQETLKSQLKAQLPKIRLVGFEQATPEKLHQPRPVTDNSGIDKIKLEGVWKCVWYQNDGEPVPKHIDTLFLFEDGVIIHQVGSKVVARWSYSVRSGDRVGEIEWTNLNPKFSGVTKAIFRMEGNSLALCSNHGREECPTSFANGRVLNVLTRVSTPASAR